MIRIISLLLVALALAGCATVPGLRPETKGPICDALVGPLRYTSVRKASRRFAGPDLAADLAVRNRVGINLRCPQYR